MNMWQSLVTIGRKISEIRRRKNALTCVAVQPRIARSTTLSGGLNKRPANRPTKSVQHIVLF